MKPCCFLPQCDIEDNECSARKKAKREWENHRPSFSRRDPPQWVMERNQREASAAGIRQRAAAVRACKRWKRGFCSKGDNCFDAHPLPPPACRSASDPAWRCELEPCPYADHVAGQGPAEDEQR